MHLKKLKQIMKKEKKQLTAYTAPTIKVVSFTIEKGFAGSPESSLISMTSTEQLTYDGNDNGENGSNWDWHFNH